MAKKKIKITPARNVREWFAFYGGEELGISLEHASIVWDAATEALTQKHDIKNPLSALRGPEKKVKRPYSAAVRTLNIKTILNDLESFINGRLELGISDEMKSAYKDVRFLVRQHIKSGDKATEKTCPYCGSHKIIMFDSDNDLCQKCNRYFHGT